MWCIACPIWKTKNWWHSVDTHFDTGVSYMSCTLLLEYAASASNGNYFRKVTIRFTRMQDQKLLTVLWSPFSGWQGDCVAIVYACKHGQYFIYGSVQPISFSITQDAKLTIIDALLMLMLKTGLWPHRFLYCQ